MSTAATSLRVPFALFAVLALAGCQSGAVLDTPKDSPAFVGDTPGDATGAIVTMRGRADGDRVMVDVVARGAPEVNGASLRVLFAPSELAFVEAAPGPRWSRMIVAAAKEGTPGQLAVAWGEKGSVSFDATDETLIGTLTFTRKTNAASKIDLRAEKSALYDRKGTATPATYRGGTVSARTVTSCNGCR